MLLPFHEYELQKIRQEELRQVWKQCHQTALCPAEPHPAQPFYGAALAGVGRVLVNVGTRLETQYSTDDRAQTTAAEVS